MLGLNKIRNILVGFCEKVFSHIFYCYYATIIYLIVLLFNYEGHKYKNSIYISIGITYN